jgi:hypothetical protein
MFWLSYEKLDFADFGGFWYKSGGRTTGVGVQAGNRVVLQCCNGFVVYAICCNPLTNLKYWSIRRLVVSRLVNHSLLVKLTHN